jgi:hypothetical protein
MRYTKAILVFSFLAASLVLFGQEPKVDTSKQGTGRQFIAIKSCEWWNEAIVCLFFPRSFEARNGNEKIFAVLNFHSNNASCPIDNGINTGLSKLTLSNYENTEIKDHLIFYSRQSLVCQIH